MSEIQWAKCRHCNKPYDPQKSRSDYEGYCTQKCLFEEAKRCGWSPSREPRNTGKPDPVYRILHNVKLLGRVKWPYDGPSTDAKVNQYLRLRKEGKSHTTAMETMYPPEKPAPKAFVPPTRAPQVMVDNAIQVLAKRVVREAYDRLVNVGQPHTAFFVRSELERVSRTIISAEITILLFEEVYKLLDQQPAA